MDTQRLPLLREHDFPSSVPVVGPLIRLVRRFLYGLTAKWAVWFLIQQQNQINRTIEDWLRAQEDRLRAQDAWLVDLDRDMTILARTVAEREIRQRYLARMPEASRAANQIQRDA